MLTSDDLKTLLFHSISRADKLLILLASFDAPIKVNEIRKCALHVGFRDIRKWNISDILGKTHGRALKTTSGWEISVSGYERLQELSLVGPSQPKQNISSSLRKKIAEIDDSQIRSFLDETVICYESGLYRSAIIMSWVGAVAILRKEVREKRFQDLSNFVRKQENTKKRNVANSGYLEKVAESEFLEILHKISVIDKGIKGELKRCLDLRNQCSHPNNLKIADNTAACHLEIVILNVYDRYN